MKLINTKENKDIGQAILSLAWPTMLEQLSQTTVQYIDTAMVGALGTQATAAVGSTSTVNWLIFSSISALSVGFLSFIARACGAYVLSVHLSAPNCLTWGWFLRGHV